MRFSKTHLLIGASTLAILGLIYFQVKWIQHSQRLLTEQFNQKVSLALCSAVSSMENKSGSSDLKSTCSVIPPTDPGLQPTCNAQLQDFVATEEFKSALEDALSFYNIHLKYEVEVEEKRPYLNPILPPNCCSLKPLLANDQYLLKIVFPDQRAFIMKKMGFMIFSSIAILAFVIAVFIGANLALINQKRLIAFNVDFFNNLAHEFRTPLMNIRLANRLLKKNKLDSSEGKYTGIIDHSCNTLNNQIERVLHLSKMEKGQYLLEKQMISLNDMIKEVINEFEIRLQEKQGQIQFTPNPGELRVLGDRFHLQNALRNIIDNALKYNHNQPLIEIGLRTTEKGVYINIADNGMGIRKKDHAVIFQKFGRLPIHQSSSLPGFGLGLSYVKLIFELHKGAIQVFSELQKGSRFELFLPHKI